MGGGSAWLLLLVLGLILMIEGGRGHMGRIVAIIFAPTYVEVVE